jgi:hypothetical protein
MLNTGNRKNSICIMSNEIIPIAHRFKKVISLGMASAQRPTSKSMESNFLNASKIPPFVGVKNAPVLRDITNSRQRRQSASGTKMPSESTWITATADPYSLGRLMIEDVWKLGATNEPIVAVFPSSHRLFTTPPKGFPKKAQNANYPHLVTQGPDRFLQIPCVITRNDLSLIEQKMLASHLMDESSSHLTIKLQIMDSTRDFEITVEEILENKVSLLGRRNTAVFQKHWWYLTRKRESVDKGCFFVVKQLLREVRGDPVQTEQLRSMFYRMLSGIEHKDLDSSEQQVNRLLQEKKILMQELEEKKVLTQVLEEKNRSGELHRFKNSG